MNLLEKIFGNVFGSAFRLKIVLLPVWVIAICSCNADNRVKVQDQFTPLPPHSIQLKGYFEHYIQHSIEHWNKGDLPYARFVDFFRTGRPQFALGEMWGKAVRSGCMFYRYTNDPELKAIMNKTVRDLLTTQRENGSISCVEIDKQPEESELWERKYVMLGLEEYYEWVNSDPEVLDALGKQADNIISIIGYAPKTEIVDVGWSATNIGFEPCHIESSTLLEPFMKLYKWTGEKRYLDFATYIIESGGTKHYNVFQNALKNVDPWKMAGHYPKAYEMMSLFEGLAEYYRVTGDPQHKEMLLNLFKNISTKEITIIGNGGSDQPYHPYVAGEAWGNTALEQTNPNISRMMETCVGVTWMKLCSQIVRLTGDPLAVDMIEKYAYNGLIGAMKPSGDGFSYVNLLNGSKVTDQGWGWKFDSLQVTCCNLNGPMGLAYLPFVAVMNSASGPVINIYNAGTAMAMTAKKHPIQLEIVTDYPVSGNVIVNVKPKVSEKFSVRLRIPTWSKTTVVKVNGNLVSVVPGTYAEINRKWSAGDKITLSFDMRCQVHQAPHGSNRAGDHFQALTRGPIVLARDENIDAGFDQPVFIKSEEGYVAGSLDEGDQQPYRIKVRIPVNNGFIHMVDYASVNSWDGKRVCTWLPKVP